MIFYLSRGKNWPECLALSNKIVANIMFETKKCSMLLKKFDLVNQKQWIEHILLRLIINYVLFVNIIT